MILRMSCPYTHYPELASMDGGRALFLSFLSQGQVPQFLSHHSGVSGHLKFSFQQQGARLALGGGGGEGQNTTFIKVSLGLLLPAD